MRNSFTTLQEEETFLENGYVQYHGFLAKEEVELLKTWYENTPNDLGLGFHATTHSKDLEYRRKVTQVISSVFKKKAAQYLKDYRPIVGTFTVKEVGPDSFFDFHLDWNMIDESKAHSLTIWVSLEDTDESNGNLWVLDKSVHHGNSYRCSPGLHMLVENQSLWETLKFEKKALRMKAGDAIIYSHKLIHGSPANLSKKRRIAINMVYLPQELPSYHYAFEEQEIKVYEVDDDFYHRCVTCEETDMQVFPLVDRIRFDKTPIRQHQINALIS